MSWAEDATGTAPTVSEVTTGTTTVVEPFTDPLAAKKHKVVGKFGKRDVPVALRAPTSTTSQTTLSTAVEMHEGVDFAAFPGSIVRASRSGKVIFAGFSKMYVSRKSKNDQHRLVIIRHPDGMSTRYVHLAGLRVKPGQEVASGQPIGTLTESDEWAEPVLHFEIRDMRGQPVDPLLLLMP